MYFKLDGSGWAFITWPVPNVSFTTRRYFCSTDQQLSWFAVNFYCEWDAVDPLWKTVASFLFFLFLLLFVVLFFSVVFLCSLHTLFTFYSLNLFPNNDKKKTITRYQKLFCNLYKFVWKSINSIKMDGNQKCHHVYFLLLSCMALYCQECWDIVKLPFPPHVLASTYDWHLTLFYWPEEEKAHSENMLSGCANLFTVKKIVLRFKVVELIEKHRNRIIFPEDQKQEETWSSRVEVG